MKADTKKIILNGEEYPILFGAYVIGKFVKNRKINLADITDEVSKDLTAFYELTYEAVKFAHFGLKKEFTLSLDEFAFVIDSDNEGLLKVQELFLASQDSGEITEEDNGEKKKEAQ